MAVPPRDDTLRARAGEAPPARPARRRRTRVARRGIRAVPSTGIPNLDPPNRRAGRGATPLTVSASSTSGLPVSFSSSTTNVCTVSGATVTIKTAGLCTIRAAQAGNGSWFAATPTDRSFTVGYGIANLFPPKSTRFKRGSTIPVVFALTGANGKQIPSAVASKLGCTVKVTFNGGTPICATWVPIVNLFGAAIKTPKTLTKGQSYPIVVTVTVGATVVASATTTVIAR